MRLVGLSACYTKTLERERAGGVSSFNSGELMILNTDTALFYK